MTTLCAGGHLVRAMLFVDALTYTPRLAHRHLAGAHGRLVQSRPSGVRPLPQQVAVRDNLVGRICNRIIFRLTAETGDGGSSSMVNLFGALAYFPKRRLEDQSNAEELLDAARLLARHVRPIVEHLPPSDAQRAEASWHSIWSDFNADAQLSLELLDPTELRRLAGRPACGRGERTIPF